MKYKILIVILLFYISDIHSQITFSLEECLEYAWKNSYVIQMSENDILKNNICCSRNIFEYFPSISIYYDHNYNAGRSLNYENYSWESEDIQQGNLSITAELIIFQGLNNLYHSKILQLQCNLSKYNLDKNKLLLGLQIIKNYYTIQLLINNIAIYQNIVASNANEVQKLWGQIEAGTIAASDLFEMIAQEKKELISKNLLENELIKEYRKLKAFIRWHEDQTLNIKCDTIVTLTHIEFPLHIDSVINIIVNHSIITAEYNEKIILSEYEIKKSKSYFYPRISLSSSISTRYLTDAVNPISGEPGYNINNQVMNNQNKQFGIKIAIPIFEHYRNRTNLDILKIETQNIITKAETEKQNLKNEIINILDDINTHKSKIIETEIMVEALQKSYYSAIEKYKYGLLDSYSLNNAKNHFINSKLDLNKSIIEYNMNMKMLLLYENFNVIRKLK